MPTVQLQHDSCATWPIFPLPPFRTAIARSLFALQTPKKPAPGKRAPKGRAKKTAAAEESVGLQGGREGWTEIRSYKSQEWHRWLGLLGASSAAGHASYELGQAGHGLPRHVPASKRRCTTPLSRTRTTSPRSGRGAGAPRSERRQRAPACAPAAAGVRHGQRLV